MGGALLLAFGFRGTHAAGARFGDGFIRVASGTLGGMLLIAGGSSIWPPTALAGMLRGDRDVGSKTEVARIIAFDEPCRPEVRG